MYVEEDGNSEKDSSEEINIVLMTEKIEKSEIFVAEASKSAVIDTACTKTVAGKQWFDNFKANLTKHSLDEYNTSHQVPALNLVTAEKFSQP